MAESLTPAIDPTVDSNAYIYSEELTKALHGYPRQSTKSLLDLLQADRPHTRHLGQDRSFVYIYTSIEYDAAPGNGTPTSFTVFGRGMVDTLLAQARLILTLEEDETSVQDFFIAFTRKWKKLHHVHYSPAEVYCFWRHTVRVYVLHVQDVRAVTEAAAREEAADSHASPLPSQHHPPNNAATSPSSASLLEHPAAACGTVIDLEDTEDGEEFVGFGDDQDESPSTLPISTTIWDEQPPRKEQRSTEDELNANTHYFQRRSDATNALPLITDYSAHPAREYIDGMDEREHSWNTLTAELHTQIIEFVLVGERTLLEYVDAQGRYQPKLIPILYTSFREYNTAASIYFHQEFVVEWDLSLKSSPSRQQRIQQTNLVELALKGTAMLTLRGSRARDPDKLPTPSIKLRVLLRNLEFTRLHSLTSLLEPDVRAQLFPAGSTDEDITESVKEMCKLLQTKGNALRQTHIEHTQTVECKTHSTTHQVPKMIGRLAIEKATYDTLLFVTNADAAYAAVQAIQLGYGDRFVLDAGSLDDFDTFREQNPEYRRKLEGDMTIYNLL